MIEFPFFKQENISEEIKNGSGSVARQRLLNTINSEHTHLSPVMTEMMQHDLKKVIESYIGNDLDSNDLIIEIKNPDYSAFVCEVDMAEE